MTELARFGDAGAGVVTTVLREDGRALIRTEQDTAPVIAGNKRAQSLYDPVNERRLPMGLRWVARLPAVVVMELNLRGIMQGAEVTDEMAFLAFLDDPEHRYLRTDNGRRLRNLRGRASGWRQTSIARS